MSLESSLESLKLKVAGLAREPALKQVRTAALAVTAAEVRAAVASNPGHPLSLGKARSVARLSDAQRVMVDRVDIEAILANRQVVSETQTVDGLTVHVKRLGAPIGQPAAEAVTPAAPASESVETE